MQTGTWRTKDGRTVRICDMDNHHLLNVLMFLERMGKDKQRYNEKLKFEDCVRPVYWCMIEEVEDRIRNGKIHGVSVQNNKLMIEDAGKI